MDLNNIINIYIMEGPSLKMLITEGLRTEENIMENRRGRAPKLISIVVTSDVRDSRSRFPSREISRVF